MTRPACIMLIDDDEDDNFFHQLVINEMEACSRIVVKESGFEAMAYLMNPANESPDLIFLDINMPAMNGWEFIEKYRAIPHQPARTVVYMLTTSLNPADREKINSIPVIAGFESKPLSAAALKRILEKHFSGAQQ